jgi:hypothetical protein
VASETLGQQFSYYDRLNARMRNGPCADCRKPGPNARLDFCANCFAARVARVTAERAARKARVQRG